MEALVNSLDANTGGDTAALSREQLEAELTKLRSENDQLRMDADDPFQLLRDLPEDEPRPSPSKLNRGKASAPGERRCAQGCDQGRQDFLRGVNEREKDTMR